MKGLNPDYYHPDFLEDVYAACPHFDLVLYKHISQAKLTDSSFTNIQLGAILEKRYDEFLKFVELPDSREAALQRKSLHNEWKAGSCYTREGVEAFFCPRFLTEREKNIVLLMTVDILICTGLEYEAGFYFLCPKWHKKEECWRQWHQLAADKSK